jgi:hypothetical protein
MKRSLAPTIVAVASVIAVVAVAWWAFAKKTSPGPLHPSHAAVAELRSGEGCIQCHGASSDRGSPGAGGMAADCAACHAPIAAQIASGAGLHGHLDKSVAAECQNCHREHLGAEVALVSAVSFELAGVPDIQKYDHARTGPYTLTGRHAELKCGACHPLDAAAALEKGEHRFVGLTQACTQCHQDTHKGHLGTDCASCHGQAKPFKQAPEFKHPDTFPLVAGHSGRDCAACHKTPGEFKDRKVDCISCHKADYDKTSKPSHAGAGLNTDCAKCHGIEAWNTGVRYEHPETFPLVGGHAKACAECHTTQSPQKLKADCINCHREVYDKTTKPAHALTGLDTRCAECHSVESWSKGVKYAHPQAFPLIGGHEKSACIGCHQPGEPNKRLGHYKKEKSCVACHDSPHDPAFDARAAAMLRTVREPDTCAVCHAPGDRLFADANTRMTVEVHAVTGFPLAAPHQITDCSKCHALPADMAMPGATDRKQRWQRLYPGRPSEECQRCHEDPHKGQFERTSTVGRCLACHEPIRFAPSTFDAAAHNGAGCKFPLAGAHRAVACSTCHKVVDGVRRFVPTATVCSECHADVHEAKFDKQGFPAAVNGKTGCERCHTVESFTRSTWTPADHQRWANYALTGKHVQATCRDCHTRAPGIPYARPPATPRACADCHADPHAGQFRAEAAPANAASDCTRCHTDTSSFKSLAFDHQRDSRFRLDADHARLACAACHKPYPVPGSSRVIVRYKPLGVTCADCHDPRTGGHDAGGTRP